ncbi:hypothetical protein CPB84DRAFT_1778042, partial [Gymnopilus junonius]
MTTGHGTPTPLSSNHIGFGDDDLGVSRSNHVQEAGVAHSGRGASLATLSHLCRGESSPSGTPKSRVSFFFFSFLLFFVVVLRLLNVLFVLSLEILYLGFGFIFCHLSLLLPGGCHGRSLLVGCGLVVSSYSLARVPV